MVRRISREILESLGYTVSEAEHGKEALARIAKHGMPGLIVLDWNMPVMTGLEMLQGLEALAGGVRPKVLVCTSSTEPREIHRGISAGATDWIVKPFDKAKLEAKLAGLETD